MLGSLLQPACASATLTDRRWYLITLLEPILSRFTDSSRRYVPRGTLRGGRRPLLLHARLVFKGAHFPPLVTSFTAFVFTIMTAFDTSVASAPSPGLPKTQELDAFHTLVQDLSRVLGPSSGIDSEDVDPAELQALMERYTSTPSEWQKYALGDYSRNYTRNLVDKGNGKSNLYAFRSACDSDPPELRLTDPAGLY